MNQQQGACLLSNFTKWPCKLSADERLHTTYSTKIRQETLRLVKLRSCFLASHMQHSAQTSSACLGGRLTVCASFVQHQQLSAQLHAPLWEACAAKKYADGFVSVAGTLRDCSAVACSSCSFLVLRMSSRTSCSLSSLSCITQRCISISEAHLHMCSSEKSHRHCVTHTSCTSEVLQNKTEVVIGKHVLRI